MKPQRHTRNRHGIPTPSNVPSIDHKHVVAKYVESLIPEYAGNEFIEALGPPLTAKQLATTMSNWPEYSEEERNESATVRKLKLLRLNRIYVPLAQQHAVAQTLADMIRDGYVHRSPSKPEFNKFLQESYDRRNVEGIVESAPDVTPICSSYAIIGVSGVGKSLLTRRALAQFPALIWHPTLRRYQIPYIVVECPHNGTVKQLILNFFTELDKIAYTNYQKRFETRKLNVEELIREVNAAAHLFGIGLIVIDEIQHASAANGATAAKLFMNFLVRFVNTSTAPVVLIGTMSSLEMLQADFRQARRMLGALLTNYKPGDEWNSFLETVWKYQWTKKLTPLDSHLSDVIYTNTQGVPALAVKLYQYAQRRAIECRAEEITVELLNEVAKDELTRVAPMVRALAEGDVSKLVKYGDLSIPDFVNPAMGNASLGLENSLADLFKRLTNPEQ